MAKVDIESAYRLVSVHPHDRALQALQWQGQLYVDPMLPFGLRLAPKIFNAIADAFHWHLEQRGINHVLHYLDDVNIVASPEPRRCQEDLNTLLRAASVLGIPFASQKTEGPATSLVFLGIEVDTVAGELRLPRDKLQRFKDLLHQWGSRRVCARWELESLVGLLNHACKVVLVGLLNHACKVVLVGLLNHACKVVRSGRSFLRRMIDLLHGRSSVTHLGARAPIRLNRSFHADLAWWQHFVEEWNGTSFLRTPPPPPPRPPITPRGLGHIWASGVRSVVGRQLQNLVFIEARSGFYLCPEYIDTHANHLADDLSRNRISSFFLKVPHASEAPTRCQQHWWTSYWTNRRTGHLHNGAFGSGVF